MDDCFSRTKLLLSLNLVDLFSKAGKLINNFQWLTFLLTKREIYLIILIKKISPWLVFFFREKMAQAYDFALDKMGLDLNSYSIWSDYVQFLKST